jgi:hypothetical protein
MHGLLVELVDFHVFKLKIFLNLKLSFNPLVQNEPHDVWRIRVIFLSSIAIRISEKMKCITLISIPSHFTPASKVRRAWWRRCTSPPLKESLLPPLGEMLARNIRSNIS